MVLKLAATNRTQRGRKMNSLRDQGFIPGIVYGTAIDPTPVTVGRTDFVKVYEQAGTSGLVELSIEGGKTVPVLIQDMSQHPISNQVAHIDFRSVDLTKEIEAEVQIRLVGESSAVKLLGGTLVFELPHVKVRALPTALVPYIEVDISSMQNLEDSIRVKDLVVPPGMKIEEDSDKTIALVAPPRTDEELESLNTAVEENVEAVEVAKKEKKEEEEEAPVEEKEKEKKSA